MKVHYDDVLEALEAAEFPLSVLIGQHRHEGFASGELCVVDIKVLYTVQDELEHMIERIKEGRARKRREIRE